MTNEKATPSEAYLKSLEENAELMHGPQVEAMGPLGRMREIIQSAMKEKGMSAKDVREMLDANMSGGEHRKRMGGKYANMTDEIWADTNRVSMESRGVSGITYGDLQLDERVLALRKRLAEVSKTYHYCGREQRHIVGEQKFNVGGRTVTLDEILYAYCDTCDSATFSSEVAGEIEHRIKLMFNED